MGWSGNTTRRQRFRYLKALYLRRELLFQRSWRWLPKSLVTPKRPRDGHKFHIIRGPNLGSPTSRWPFVFDGLLLPPVLWPFVQIAPIDNHNPPHVKFTLPSYLAMVALNKHTRFAIVGYHKRRVRTRSKRQRDPRNTSFNLRVSGSNFFYFRNGCFSDNDVLHRHPNETDIANGAPFPTDPWPIPLGYV